MTLLIPGISCVDLSSHFFECLLSYSLITENIRLIIFKAIVRLAGGSRALCL